MTKEQKIEKLKAKKAELENKLFEARCLENERMNRMGFGYGMRHAKINLSTRRSDNLRRRIEETDEKIQALING